MTFFSTITRVQPQIKTTVNKSYITWIEIHMEDRFCR